MPGPKKTPAHPLKRGAKIIPKRAPGADVADDGEPSARGPKLDGAGLPFVTLAQFLKVQGVADTGGAAKHLVRGGTVKVNNAVELRPGRKLHDGDHVRAGGKDLPKVVIVLAAAVDEDDDE
jgi:ribosome-associated protein